MKNLKPVLWVAVGMIVGAAGALAASQTAPAQKAPDVKRLQATYAGMAVSNSAYFLKDPKSGGCWLALYWQADNVNLAPAPKEACD